VKMRMRNPAPLRNMFPAAGPGWVGDYVRYPLTCVRARRLIERGGTPKVGSSVGFMQAAELR
jgi:hypothetical protein